jgi:integrase
MTKAVSEMQFLTSDNTHLSRPTSPFPQAESAVDCTSAKVAEYLDAGTARSSRAAFRADLAHFDAWGAVLPCSPTTVAEYLAAHAEELSAATLSRRLASISKAHGLLSAANPVQSELVRATLRGIRRAHGVPQRQARPLIRDDLFLVLESMPEGLRAIRDRALLLVGFAGALRRSELVGLDTFDIEHVRKGIVLHLRRSKTDQNGIGQQLAIPYGRTKWCPVSRLDEWMQAAKISFGPVFRPVDRHGIASVSRLSGEAVARIVKDRAVAAGLERNAYSGHSLRAGFATSAAALGLPAWQIRAQTRHASEAMLNRYIRVGEMFTCNAAAALL